MDPARLPAVLIAVFALLAGCRTSDPFVEYTADPEAPGGWRAPSHGEGPGSYGAPEAAPPVKTVEKAGRIVFGAWGFDGRLQGKAAGAPSDHGMDVSAIPGFSLEARFHSRGEEPGSWSTYGILLEHFRGAEEKAVAGGTARTEGALTGAWFVLGLAGNPYRDGQDAPVDFGHRVDFLIGLRRGFVKAEVPDGFGGTYRKSSTWGELAFGLRAEWSPCRRVFLFVRGDVGSEANTRAHSDDEETQGDSAVGAISSQFMAGVRVRPADHVSLVAGWRYLRLDGKEIVNDGTEDVATARAAWSGPWAGIEVDF